MTVTDSQFIDVTDALPVEEAWTQFRAWASERGIDPDRISKRQIRIKHWHGRDVEARITIGVHRDVLRSSGGDRVDDAQE
jgi:hypothetical protein